MNSFTNKNVSVIDPWKIEEKPPNIPMPLPCYLSFAPLIKMLQGGYDTGNLITNKRNQEIADLAGSIPELLQPITNSEIFSRHVDIIAALMGAIFPVNFGKMVSFAAIFPFQQFGFWTSKAFADIFLSDQGNFLGTHSVYGKNDKNSMILDLYKFVLADGFGLGAAMRQGSELFEAKRHDTGLNSFHRMYLDLSYCKVKVEDYRKKLDPEFKDKISRSMNDIEEIMKIFPLDGISIEGFTIVRTFDVTQQEAFSRIKQLLLSEHKNHRERGQELENLLRILCGDPSLRIGLFIEFEGKLLQSIGLGIQPEDARPVWYNLGVELDFKTLEGSAHQKVMETRSTLEVCLQSKPNKSLYEKSLFDQGVSSYVVAPLIVDSKFIGIFEITSEKRFDQFDFKLLEINTLVDLVKIATKRRIDHIDESVERRIKSQCTAVHSSVEWIFRRAALKASQKITKYQSESYGKEHLEASMEPIIFTEVYPLYGIVDIRGSSAQRSRAVQRDFLNNLSMIKEIFIRATQFRGLPLIDFLKSRLDYFLQEVSDSMNTNSELIISDFIKKDLEPALKTVGELVPSVKHDIANYWKKLDRKHQSFYVA